ncbi:MAG: cell filamentation protein Fic [Candidatus Cloacimonetes bacterium HGW-Cloacimonetes-3]|nr:MAG: cell filamentation protein Fic [Candidatus Cloacimonetes bacterium HGW-Cloacimonetes-3]
MKPFIPDSLPLANINWEAHVNSIGKAQAALARYDGMLQSIVNPGLLLAPLTTQEAVLSSRIEGTQATLMEVFEFEAHPKEKLSPEKRADIQEILNYRNAINFAVTKLQTHPLTINVIKEIHAILMDSVRGRNKAPGEFRKIQNYIGAQGAGIEQALYIPPSPEQVMPGMGNLETYIHTDEKDSLVQLAIVKAQFEIIHPFLDGNGRIGRILIPLFLYHKQMLASPMFYLSYYLENHRELYYEKLRGITSKGDWNGWIAFFLQAIIEQAEMNINKAKQIQDLYDKLKLQIPHITNSKYSIQATDALFLKPLFSSTDFINTSGIPYRSALRVLSILKEKNILKTVSEMKGSKAESIVLESLLEIVG